MYSHVNMFAKLLLTRVSVCGH